jgi:hypothetical protein
VVLRALRELLENLGRVLAIDLCNRGRSNVSGRRSG